MNATEPSPAGPPADACYCGWKVPKALVVYCEDDSVDVAYDCPECGHKWVTEVHFKREEPPAGVN